MTVRLVELYPVETAVQILLGDHWQPGRVIRHEFPAVWVKTIDGREWFVTNQRHICLLVNKGER